MTHQDDVAAEAVVKLGLRHIETEELSIERLGRQGSFAYERKDGRTLGKRDLKRILALVIPPAWAEVRIAQDPNAHLQAIGRDDAGRLQYIYHADWEDVRTAVKTQRLLQMGDVLSRLRKAIDRDISTDGPNLATATAARLIDLLHLRAGHEGYAGDESGRGVATLLKRHLELDGTSFRLRFRGKGGKRISKICEDAQALEALRKLRSVRGSRLFKINRGDGYRPMTATDLNNYLRAESGRAITAKDFRTLYASAAALDFLVDQREGTTSARRKAIIGVARRICEELANTPIVTRKSYIHPLILSHFENGMLAGSDPVKARAGQTAAESRLMRFLAELKQ
jgi:DNA topoisomerase I